MKRMKKLISIGSVTALTLVLLIVFVSALAAAKPASVSGSGIAYPIFSQWEYKGEHTVTLYIGGVQYDVAVYTVYFKQSSPNKGGAYHTVTIEQIFDFSGDPYNPNSIHTIDRVILEPTETTGLYTLTQKATSLWGDGEFSGATGKLRINGTIDGFGTADAILSFEVSGSISY